MKSRCSWCNLNNPVYVIYHDNEWGILKVDDKYLFEMLLLESFQAGLSWECILNKRENFRLAYDNFDILKIVNYSNEDVTRLLNDKGIIRNRRKILASIHNASVFEQIVLEFGSFYNYISTFSDGNILYEVNRTSNWLSDKISIDLQRRGMKFVGSVIIYSFLQAIGVINSHERNCFKYREV